jgi:hypothetical protein
MNHFRFTTRDLLWLTAVVAMGCALGLTTLYAARVRAEAASYRRLAEDRKEQFDLIFAEWQRQKPKTIKHTNEGKYIITPESGPPITLKP